MIWAQAYETNLDCLRRYAAFSCGSQGLGDDVVHDALMDVLGTVSSAKTTNRIALFQKLEASLRDMPGGEAAVFEDLGRWRLLSPRERRVIILCVLEKFSVPDIVRITGLTQGEVKGILGRGRMMYADRFPARVGLIGGGEAIRQSVADALSPLSHRLLWSVDREEARSELAHLPPASMIVIVQEGSNVSDVEELCSGYMGPVILARDGAIEDRLSARLWTLPLHGLTDATLFTSMLVRALLFSD